MAIMTQLHSKSITAHYAGINSIKMTEHDVNIAIVTNCLSRFYTMIESITLPHQLSVNYTIVSSLTAANNNIFAIVIKDPEITEGELLDLYEYCKTKIQA